MAYSDKEYTLKDVAHEAKVSVGTVSNYLNNPESVKPYNRVQIRRAINLLGFTPNVNAQILATGKPKTIILYILSEDQISPTTWLHQLPMVQTVHDHLEREGYSIQIRIVYAKDAEGFYNNVRRCVESKVAGGILFLSVWKIPEKIIEYLLDRKFPFVCLDNECDYEEVTSIFFDNYGAMRELVGILHRKGHRNIAFISVRSEQQDMRYRYLGYLDGMKECQLPVTTDQVLFGDFSIESGRHCVQEALDRGLSVTAILCGNDNMAVGALQAINARGLRVPEDISLIGVDNSIAANACSPRLETVEFDLAHMGELSAKELLHILNSDRWTPRRIKLGYSLISGQTVCALSAATGREKYELQA